MEKGQQAFVWCSLGPIGLSPATLSGCSDPEVVQRYASGRYLTVREAFEEVKGRPSGVSAAILVLREPAAVAREMVYDALTIAEPGELVLNQEAANELKDLVETSDRGNTELGLARRVERLCVMVGVTPIEPLEPETQFFIGRERELGELRRILDLSRLVTLTGGPAVGKSALMMRLFEEVAPNYSESWTIDFGPLSAGSLVGPSILRLLGIRKPAEHSSRDALKRHFGSKSAILALDSIGVAHEPLRSVVSTLLADCPNLQIVVASSRPLRLPGEVRFVVPGLECATEYQPWRDIALSDAAALFTDRSQLVAPDFRVSPANAPHVARLCTLLEGHPLAIEIAASQSDLLAPHQLVRKFEGTSAILQGGASEVPNPLQVALAWTFDQLSNSAKKLLHLLRVFAGPFCVEDAQNLAVQAKLLTEEETFACFSELVDRSLLVPQPTKYDRRFVLGAFIKPYLLQLEPKIPTGVMSAWDKLTSERLAEASVLWDGPEPEIWTERMEALDHEVCTLIPHRLKSKRTAASAVDLALSMARFWYTKGYLQEGMQVAEDLISHRETSDSASYPRLINMLVIYAAALRDFRASKRYLRMALQGAMERKDDSALATSWINYSFSATLQGKPRTCARAAHQAYLAAQRANDTESMRYALLNILGAASDLSRVDEGEWAAHTLRELDPEGTERSPVFHLNYGNVRLCKGDETLGVGHLEMSFSLSLGQGAGVDAAKALRSLARHFLKNGEFDFACRIFGNAERLIEDFPVDPLIWTERRDLQRDLDYLEKMIGSRRKDELLQQGRETRPEEILRIRG